MATVPVQFAEADMPQQNMGTTGAGMPIRHALINRNSGW
jgi:hypothetical protein